MEGHRSNKIKTKLAATQSVIKKKFKKAYANRLQHEHDVNQAIEPITTVATPTTSTLIPTPSLINNSESEENNISLRDLSQTKNIAHQLRLATKSYYSYKNNRSARIDDPNELCDRLRLLLASRNADNETNTHIREIKSIVAKLHELGILI